jgi:hypothetical protein
MANEKKLTASVQTTRVWRSSGICGTTLGMIQGRIRVRLSYGARSWGVENGGVEVLPVNFQALHSFNTGVPEGAKIAIWGDPLAFTPAVTGFFFGNTIA